VNKDHGILRQMDKMYHPNKEYVKYLIMGMMIFYGQPSARNGASYK